MARERVWSDNPLDAADNPLLSGDPAVFDQLIQDIDPASLLVVINSRMGTTLKRRYDPEDILQEAFTHAWRDRHKCDWRGIKSFRSWLLSIIDNRIKDRVAYEEALKRGGGNTAVPFSALEHSRAQNSHSAAFQGPTASTTPSRIAIYKEQASAMKVALNALPPGLQNVVRLRIFEQLTVEETSARLDITPSTVRRRLLKGCREYERALRSELATRSLSISPKALRFADPDSSPME